MATAVNVSATNNAEIDGLLSGYKWTGTITYSFPDASSDYPNPYYGGSSEPTTSGFASAPTQIQAAINYAIGLILSYTNADIQYAGTNGADIMIAQSPAANPTAYAYYPGNYASGGDVWFGTQYNFSLAKLGNYYFTTALHELGHAFGLKHSQEAGGPGNVAVPSAHDDSEYTVMSYRSYVGGSTTSGYTNEAYGYSQTYMANDILALQTMYGADYTTQSGSTVYTWNPTTGQEFINGVGQLAPGGGVGGSANRIYETVWDGGGVDTYDLSNYTTNLSINLNPGASSVFSSVQLAYLGNGHYASGNVYNAYLYSGDARSYIDNAIGGSGNDAIVGNAIANTLNGGGGNDTITGGAGNDTIIGGSGTDTAVYSGSRANYMVSYNAATQTFTVVDLRSGSPDGTDAVASVEYFQFADGTIASVSVINVAVEAVGSTSLVQTGDNFYLKAISTGSGPVLKISGSPVSAAVYGTWAPIAAEQTGGGYDVAWRDLVTGHYTVWSTDSNGNYTGNIVPEVTGTNASLRSLETTFQQDLNGDGTIGIPSATIESQGSTKLVQTGDNFYLEAISTGSGPVLKISGSPVSAAVYGTWAPIAAEQTGGGYDVAWRDLVTGHYTVWSTDSNGNYTGNIVPEVTGTNASLRSLETTFQQDLNSDGTIGIPSATVEVQGSTKLVQTGDNFYLEAISTGSGPVLKISGSPVSAAVYGTWAPIAAEQTGGGYDVAWRDLVTGHYTVWSTDSNGNYTGNIVPEVTGTNASLRSLETTFQQDLNGDGTIGIPSATVEAQGSTKLVQTGDNFYLEAISAGSGPVLKISGSPVSAAVYGTWAPFAAEQTAGGYDVAWRDSVTGHYTVWGTDSNGNYTGNIVPEVTGTNASFQSLETTFHQDLNGDGAVGVPSAAARADTSSATAFLLRHNEGFVFQPEIEPTGKTDTNSGLPDSSNHLLRTGFLLETQAFSFDHGFWEDQRSDPAFSPIDYSSLSHIAELLARTFLFH
ncbi:M10 family metallopeptidase C-terminal domain-containing protein [Bradyrhizobium sp. PRIMUS42]|uniref:M10 family metallopeptidase C-terminal domain-containing protein n=1 Tax=Bradyrhizobium sp. PRIMUS42 TaxID=2908926 RepID=UPI001FF1B98D|nr:M10 family metallopeptidase C-terminal domain-containing protein [Bradyrhizobium sp. PRIMUS42]MCJ9729140.1 M10 family metallopeptidase C-terminal domain-containing protein [Bradyrhizobium sp. PRIMUS42]